jgi:hypothetical protein
VGFEAIDDRWEDYVGQHENDDSQKPQKTWTTIRRDGDTVVLEVAGVVPIVQEGMQLDPVPVILHLSLGEASALGQELMMAVYGKGEIRFVRWE